MEPPQVLDIPLEKPCNMLQDGPEQSGTFGEQQCFMDVY